MTQRVFEILYFRLLRFIKLFKLKNNDLCHVNMKRAICEYSLKMYMHLT